MPFWLPYAASLVALVTAVTAALVVAFRPTPRHSHPAINKRVNGLELELIECLDRLDKLTVVAKRKYARDSARTRGKNVELSDEDWKKKMQLNYALGKTGVMSNGD